jgi:predicted adenylyl cyclase CyaB
MRLEREVKIQVADFRAVRRALRQRQAIYLATVEQTDELFDTPAGDLSTEDVVVRLRSQRVLRRGTASFDGRSMLTIKGPRLPHSAGVKLRREHHAYADDADAMVLVLEALGANRAVTIQKRRSTYRLGESLVELDELPLIGRFVEIESPSDEAIVEVRATLGLAGPAVEESYVELLARASGQTGRRGWAVTF